MYPGDGGFVTGGDGVVTGGCGFVTGGGGVVTGGGGVVTGDGVSVTGGDGVVTGDGVSVTGGDGVVTGDGVSVTGGVTGLGTGSGGSDGDPKHVPLINNSISIFFVPCSSGLTSLANLVHLVLYQCHPGCFLVQ